MIAREFIVGARIANIHRRETRPHIRRAVDRLQIIFRISQPVDDRSAVILDELQLLADSHEPTKRERGRRGLEILNQLQRSREVELTVHDSTTEDLDLGADARLVRIAKVLKGDCCSPRSRAGRRSRGCREWRS